MFLFFSPPISFLLTIYDPILLISPAKSKKVKISCDHIYYLVQIVIRKTIHSQIKTRNCNMCPVDYKAGETNVASSEFNI